MMGSLMGCSFESMVIDNEAIGMIARSLRGIEVSDDTLSVEVIHSSAIDPGHFLGNSQTLAHMESEYVYPTLMDRTPTDQWEKEGSQDLFSRSQERVDEILSSHYPNFFGDSVDVRIRQEFPIHLPKSQMGS
jgi:trimethylamine--corrinoid protein Co-methyltransferase